MSEIIQASTPLEGEILTDKAPDTVVDKLAAIIQECEGYLQSILDMAQRIDHGMSDCPPNAPNREIVRTADAALRWLNGALDVVEAQIEHQENTTLLIEGNSHDL